MKKSQVLVLVLAGLATTGCVRAIKHNEVLWAMRDLGLSDPDARCIASRASRQLSVGQLRSLQAAARNIADRSGNTPLPAAVLRVRDKVDAETLGISVRIAAECVAERASRSSQ